MIFKRLNIEDVVLIEPKVHEDDRGYFVETFREDRLYDFLGYKINFCQDNESKSSRGVLRGLHYQLPPFAQTKLVRVIKGSVIDYAIDIRKGSPTFGKYVSAKLTSKNKHQLLVPRGFAHAFLVLEDETVFAYKVDSYYDAASDRGIAYNDEDINIKFDFNTNELVLSQKDKNQPPLKENNDLFEYGIDYYG